MDGSQTAHVSSARAAGEPRHPSAAQPLRPLIRDQQLLQACPHLQLRTHERARGGQPVTGMPRHSAQLPHTTSVQHDRCPAGHQASARPPPLSLGGGGQLPNVVTGQPPPSCLRSHGCSLGPPRSSSTHTSSSRGCSGDATLSHLAGRCTFYKEDSGGAGGASCTAPQHSQGRKDRAAGDGAGHGPGAGQARKALGARTQDGTGHLCPRALCIDLSAPLPTPH